MNFGVHSRASRIWLKKKKTYHVAGNIGDFITGKYPEVQRISEKSEHELKREHVLPDEPEYYLVVRKRRKSLPTERVSKKQELCFFQACHTIYSIQNCPSQFVWKQNVEEEMERRKGGHLHFGSSIMRELSIEQVVGHGGSVFEKDGGDKEHEFRTRKWERATVCSADYHTCDNSECSEISVWWHQSFKKARNWLGNDAPGVSSRVLLCLVSH